MANNQPTCIVVGCKNGTGYSNPNVKYCQVPAINTAETAENNIARQWYINTLREDLLEFMASARCLQEPASLLLPKPPHYVCIEHFDEESFLVHGMVGGSEQFSLKEDAVPSLFEIEVFQKMIAHQEQISLSEQKQAPPPPPPQRSNSTSSFLSNLILNNNQQPQQQQQQQQLYTTTVSTNKRVRMDPDTRAALIQRVPKAVKRTSLINPPMAAVKQPVAPLQQASSSSSSTTFKAQKAVKHTMPRSLMNQNVSQQQQFMSNNKQPTSAYDNFANTQSQGGKNQKAVKHTAANNYLKEILPPPIMQSTKRVGTNKAIKHTGGGSHSYYQSLGQQAASTNGQQPLTQLNLNNLTASVNATEASKQANGPKFNPATNKITMTTTYVYKRVSQQPEIDLNLECEEEDLIYIVPPVSPPPPPTPPPLTQTIVSPAPEIIKGDVPESDAVKLAGSSLQKKPCKDSEAAASADEKLAESVKLFKKNALATHINKIKSKTKVPDTELDQEDSTKASQLVEAALLNEDALDEKSEAELKAEPVKLNQIKKINDSINDQSPKQDTNDKPANGYSNVLGKFYSRRHGAMASALEIASCVAETELSLATSAQTKLGSKKSRAANAALPNDLRMGHYPAKVSSISLWHSFYTNTFSILSIKIVLTGDYKRTQLKQVHKFFCLKD